MLDKKYAFCMANNGKDTKNTSKFDIRIHFVRNGEKCKNAQN